MDVIKFTMLEFKPRKITNQGALGGRRKSRKEILLEQSFYQFLEVFKIKINADWGDGRMNPLQAAGVETLP